VEFPEGIPQVWTEDSSGVFIDYSAKLAFVHGEISRRVARDLYMGFRLTYSYVNTEFDAALIPHEVLHLFGMGLVVWSMTVATTSSVRRKAFTPARVIS